MGRTQGRETMGWRPIRRDERSEGGRTRREATKTSTITLTQPPPTPLVQHWCIIKERETEGQRKAEKATGRNKGRKRGEKPGNMNGGREGGKDGGETTGKRARGRVEGERRRRRSRRRRRRKSKGIEEFTEERKKGGSEGRGVEGAVTGEWGRRQNGKGVDGGREGGGSERLKPDKGRKKNGNGEGMQKLADTKPEREERKMQIECKREEQ